MQTTQAPPLASFEPAPGKTEHFVLLDGLRGIAALFVVLGHYLHPMQLDYLIENFPLAVDFFLRFKRFCHCSRLRKSDTIQRDLCDLFRKNSSCKIVPIVCIWCSDWSCCNNYEFDKI